MVEFFTLIWNVKHGISSEVQIFASGYKHTPVWMQDMEEHLCQESSTVFRAVLTPG